MKRLDGIKMLGVGLLAVVCACATARLAPLSPERLAAQSDPLKAMRAKGTEASITVFPVYMGYADQPQQRVGEALGLLLEKEAGMTNISATGEVFRFPREADFDRAPELFGAFVREHPIATDYALYAEIAGTPKSGPTEIRATVVDQAGRAIWLDRQTPDSDVFKRIKPNCPLTYCLVVSERLRVDLGLMRPVGPPAEDGNMAKLWAEK